MGQGLWPIKVLGWSRSQRSQGYPFNYAEHGRDLTIKISKTNIFDRFGPISVHFHKEMAIDSEQ